MSSRRRATLVIVLGVALLVAGVTPTIGATPKESFQVSLNEGGDARVALTLTFDLSTDNERQAFERVRSNQTARQELASTYAERLRGIAAQTENETGRSMTIKSPSVSVRSTDDTGVVELTATWTNLAATDGEELVVSEPFANGFQSDRPFVVAAPAGYELTTITPAADARSDGTGRWRAGASLDGLRVVAAPGDETANASPTGAAGPGFTAVAGLAALVVGVLLTRGY